MTGKEDMGAENEARRQTTGRTAQERPTEPGGQEGVGRRADLPEGSLHIRRLCKRDAAEIAALERKIFGTPWSEKMVEDSIAHGEEERQGVSYAALGAFLSQAENSDLQSFLGSKKEQLVGYLFAMAAAGEGELHRIATAPSFRRQGIGDVLIEALFSWFSGLGEGGIWLEVRAGNKAAVSLYKKHGFLETGRRKNYYQNPTEDASIFVYH
ncbi:MAG: ribosomal protein S18-alanine N-acetyltransferase [Lachnospiraceae bacterium]|nr:ribosomal protein S18-alanine N-acetyltransferase [Lachnospiraceae bacterium]